MSVYQSLLVEEALCLIRCGSLCFFIEMKDRLRARFLVSGVEYAQSTQNCPGNRCVAPNTSSIVLALDIFSTSLVECTSRLVSNLPKQQKIV